MRTRRTAIVFVLIVGLLLSAQAALAGILLKVGSTGEAVKLVQMKLKDLGYQSEAPLPPYRYTISTKAAVRKFQLANSLQATGVVDDATHAALFGNQPVTYTQYLDNIHRPGRMGREIKATEYRLKRLGYFTGAPNTRYDENTARVVGIFQRAHGLEQSGNADSATRNLLFGPKENLVTFAEYIKRSHLSTLRKGNRGDEVAMLQGQLKELGYFTGSADGLYKNSTVLAVKLFQHANGLRVTGIAGMETRALLNDGLGKGYPVYLGEQANVQVELGDRGLTVLLLQRQLTELGFYKGPLNGIFTPAVENSVKRFQIANKVNTSDQHGVATPQTRQRMGSDAVVSRYDSEGYMPGDTHPMVQEITTRLKVLGYLPRTYTKYITPVRAAVVHFQVANELAGEAEGVVTPATFVKLKSEDTVSYEDYLSQLGERRIEKVIALAMSLKGRRYRSPCTPPKNFDCSGFVRYCMGKAVHIRLSGEIVTQGNQCRKRFRVIENISDLKRGDLLFFAPPKGSKSIGHAAICLGKGKDGVHRFIHASSEGKGVTVTRFNKEYYNKKFLFGARWVPS
ncbi:MAG: peptidoglycan-binding protein [Candidatus Excrementavichristensenella sp.]|jgi:peptidoglycan hydrolase-like protein with peptidoglycan-binding domain